ncbi:xylulokinase/hypothetical protein [Sulfurivirga caldicuralii]|uniref:Carbohydrate kinase FGGY C-terminal domain-containing protein n=1 Tax=Sulfurivirga caldicuralii TaxID=364032 RepID=A0A1N6FEN2_9GAMM|nr:FGGY-family carbohydrate kinase [Sulfurivirga caldicuralii]SIN93748.1 xylulokinase/hypothetical protein [Sulfurivirga caldicuralii]
MSDGWILGLDLGTSGLRGVITDETGEIHAEAAAPLTDQSPTTWSAALSGVLLELKPHLSRVHHIIADATSSTVMLWDNGVSSPVLMYDDGRATQEYAAIRDQLPADSAAHGATSTLSKVLWLRNHCPVSSGTRIAHQVDWLNAQFLGFPPPTDWNNALKLGYDPIREQWPDVIEQLLSPLSPPKVVPSGTPLGSVQEAVQDTWGFPHQCTVHAGTTDSIAGFLAAGAQALGDAVSSLGTTLALKIVSERPIFSPSHGIYSHRLGRRWLAGGASNVGGGSLLEMFSLEQVRALSKRQPGPKRGIACYPLRGVGERFPEADAKKAGLWPDKHLPEAVRFQAIVEALVAIEKKGYERLHALGAPAPQRIFCVGGGCRNAMWQRLRSAQLPHVVAQTVERPPAWGVTRLLADEGP